MMLLFGIEKHITAATKQAVVVKTNLFMSVENFILNIYTCP